MATVPNDYVLGPDQHEDPVIWTALSPEWALGMIRLIDTTDEAMIPFLGRGKSMRLKSFGHDREGVHFLLTRAGTTVHTDKAYTRYSHQIILRNDGNRLRGLPRFDREQTLWHPPLVPGMMYALDTHSPHQGLADPRPAFANRGAGMKAVIAVDRDEPLAPADAWALFEPWLSDLRQFSDVDFDPTRTTSPRTKDGRVK